MKLKRNVDATFNKSQRMSFTELYNEISSDLDSKIAKFQARAELVCTDDEWKY